MDFKAYVNLQHNMQVLCHPSVICKMLFTQLPGDIIVQSDDSNLLSNEKSISDV